MSKAVERITERALTTGGARSGPWEVEVDREKKVARLYHYAHELAIVHLSTDTIEAVPRPGYDFSVSDTEGLTTFFDALGISYEKWPKFRTARQAYGVNAQGYRGGSPFPARRAI